MARGTWLSSSPSDRVPPQTVWSQPRLSHSALRGPRLSRAGSQSPHHRGLGATQGGQGGLPFTWGSWGCPALQPPHNVHTCAHMRTLTCMYTGTYTHAHTSAAGLARVCVLQQRESGEHSHRQQTAPARESMLWQCAHARRDGVSAGARPTRPGRASPCPQPSCSSPGPTAGSLHSSHRAWMPPRASLTWLTPTDPQPLSSDSTPPAKGP